MSIFRCSASNISTIYNTSLGVNASSRITNDRTGDDDDSGGELEPHDFSPRMRKEFVTDAFTILALIRDADRRRASDVLCVSHNGMQRDRFLSAMEHRNKLIIDEGQPEMMHACDVCMQSWTRPDGAQGMFMCNNSIALWPNSFHSNKSDASRLLLMVLQLAMLAVPLEMRMLTVKNPS
jgi:hypothetical protein